MLTEAYLPNKELVKYYGTNFTEHSGDISQLPLNFGFISDFNSPEDVTAAKVTDHCFCVFKNNLL